MKYNTLVILECWTDTKNLGPKNTLGVEVQLGHFHHSKMDRIQIPIIFLHKKMNLMVSFNFGRDILLGN